MKNLPRMFALAAVIALAACAGGTPTTQTAAAGAGAVLVEVQALAPLAEAEAKLAPADAARVNAGLAQAVKTVAALGSSPSVTSVNAALTALFVAVNSFPAGPRHDEAVAAVATLGLVYGLVTGTPAG